MDIAEALAAEMTRAVVSQYELAGVPAQAPKGKPVNCFPNQFTGGVTCM